MQSSSQIVTTNNPTPNFWQADALSVVQPTSTDSQSTEGKKYHIPETCHNKLAWVIKQVLLVWGQYLVEQICGDHSAYN